jgi:hypothetical protein
MACRCIFLSEFLPEAELTVNNAQKSHVQFERNPVPEYGGVGGGVLGYGDGVGCPQEHRRVVVQVTYSAPREDQLASQSNILNYL